jgi:hypothetical protein
MDNLYLSAFIVSSIFFIIKFIELRFITKEEIILKKMIINTIVVYFSVIVGYFISDQFKISKSLTNEAPVFTDGPGF